MVGSHMADYLLDKAGIIGLKRWRSPIQNIEHILNKVNLYDGDLKDLPSIVQLLKQTKPDVIYHFAAQSEVYTSFSMPVETLLDNGLGTLNLLEAVRIVELDPIIIIASSSEVYGQVMQAELPIREINPLRPMSPYAVSKVCEDMLGFQYYQSYGMKIIRTRPFTHTGPRRPEAFHESSFAKQVALIDAGRQEPEIRVGNLESIRTYMDVRDAVRAYWLARDCPAGEVYNICGETVKKVNDVLGFFLQHSTYYDKRKPIKIMEDKLRIRPSDVTNQVCSCEKFIRDTNWRPEIKFETTMLDLLQFWRERI